MAIDDSNGDVSDSEIERFYADDDVGMRSLSADDHDAIESLGSEVQRRSDADTKTVNETRTGASEVERVETVASETRTGADVHVTANTNGSARTAHVGVKRSKEIRELERQAAINQKSFQQVTTLFP